MKRSYQVFRLKVPILPHQQIGKYFLKIASDKMCGMATPTSFFLPVKNAEIWSVFLTRRPLGVQWW